MKIAFIGNQLRAMANFWPPLLEQMRECGHVPVLLAPPGHDEAHRAAIGLFRELGLVVREYPLSRKGLNPLEDARTFSALCRIIREIRPDLCFASTIKPVIWGCLAARVCGVPRVYAAITGLGYAFEEDSWLKKSVSALAGRLYRLALAGASGVFFQNPDDAALFRSRRLIGPDTLIFMTRGVGVDVRRFAPAPFPPFPPAGPLTFLMVARLLKAKGVTEYARAGQILAGKCRLELLGPPEDGPGAAPLSEILDWQKQGWLTWLGETSDVRPYLANCHCLVLPSYREGTPTAVMEAMATGRPCIVTDAPGCRELVRDGENGFLVPVGNADALAAAMQRFVDDPALARQMGAMGRAMAERELDAAQVAKAMCHDMGLE